MKKTLTQNEIDEIVENAIDNEFFKRGEFPDCCGITVLSTFDQQGIEGIYEDKEYYLKRAVDQNDEKMPTKAQWIASIKRVLNKSLLSEFTTNQNIMMSLLTVEQKSIISIVRALKPKVKGVLTFKPMVSQTTRNRLTFITFVGNTNVKELAEKKKKK